MSSDVPAPPGAPDPVPVPHPRRRRPKPRKRFILIGSGVGSSWCWRRALHLPRHHHQRRARPRLAPGPGDAVPAFTARTSGRPAPVTVVVPAGDGSGAPTVLLFFGTGARRAMRSCRRWPPPCAPRTRRAARCPRPGHRRRQRGHPVEGPVLHHAQRGDLPRGLRPRPDHHRGGLLLRRRPRRGLRQGRRHHRQVVRGDVLTPAAFTADEQALVRSLAPPLAFIPSGR